MKKQTLILASLMAVSVASAQNIGVTVDGRPIEFEGTQPKMVNNSVLVPLRGVFEEMGATVRWNQARQQVTAIQGDKKIRLVIGEHTASIDGRSVRLNTPATVVNGSTLVPLRFLSEALGAQVRWNPNRMMVMVRTNEDGRAQPIRNGNTNSNRDAIATLYKATVIPVRLNTELSSNESRAGDKFTATIDSTEGVYSNFPSGSKIEGRVITATKQNGSNPGLLELQFDRLILPSGTAEDLDGTLVSLSDKNLVRDSEGRITATGKSKDNKGIYAGYGAGAGLIVGLLGRDTTKGTLTKAVLGGLLGFGAGALQQSQDKKPKNVHLNEGTKFGVRLDNDLTLYRDR
jgi:hypothetical protein